MNPSINGLPKIESNIFVNPSMQFSPYVAAVTVIFPELIQSETTLLEVNLATGLIAVSLESIIFICPVKFKFIIRDVPLVPDDHNGVIILFLVASL